MDNFRRTIDPNPIVGTGSYCCGIGDITSIQVTSSKNTCIYANAAYENSRLFVADGPFEIVVYLSSVKVATYNKYKDGTMKVSSIKTYRNVRAATVYSNTYRMFGTTTTGFKWFAEYSGGYSAYYVDLRAKLVSSQINTDSRTGVLLIYNRSNYSGSSVGSTVSYNNSVPYQLNPQNVNVTITGDNITGIAQENLLAYVSMSV